MIDLTKYKAFLFDLNGTMIDDMHWHVTAWHQILNRLGAGLNEEEVKAQCYGKNEELVERVFPGRFSWQDRHKLGVEKEIEYRRGFEPDLKLIAGLDVFLQCSFNAAIPMAIGSAAIRSNVDFVIDGLCIRQLFSAIVSAEDVKHSKPDPETFLECARRLNVPPADCLVFEDAPKGVEAALNANMDCLVLTTLHKVEEFSAYANVIGAIADYQGLRLTRPLRSSAANSHLRD
jgi:beta-phosphoglucomutase